MDHRGDEVHYEVEAKEEKVPKARERGYSLAVRMRSPATEEPGR